MFKSGVQIECAERMLVDREHEHSNAIRDHSAEQNRMHWNAGRRDDRAARRAAHK